MYTKEDILQKCSDAMADIKNFYKQDFLNYRGRSAEGELYTEIVAGFIIEHIEEFKTKIPMITRESSYKVSTHNGEYNENSPRVEEITAMKMFNQCKTDKLAHIGKIIDYQTPLKNVKTDDAGKIDLLADDGKQLIILELKRPDSDETMLRCVMEGFTYLKTVNKQKLLSDFGYSENYGLSASPFVFAGGSQFSEVKEDRPNLKRLMELLESVPYYITEKNGNYSVTADLAVPAELIVSETASTISTDQSFVKTAAPKDDEERQVIIGGVFGAVAIIAAILSVVFGEISLSAVFGCIKDVFGTLVAVVLLLALLKRSGGRDFESAFNAKMEELIEKYKPLLSVNPDKDPDHPFQIATNLDALFTKNVTATIRFFDIKKNISDEKTTIWFFIRDRIFLNRCKNVSHDIYKALDTKFNNIADVRLDQKQVAVAVEFKKPLKNKYDAQMVAEVIDYAVFCYIAKYKNEN